jgi:hypothetical protein
MDGQIIQHDWIDYHLVGYFELIDKLDTLGVNESDMKAAAFDSQPYSTIRNSSIR